jgi:ribosome-associated protein
VERLAARLDGEGWVRIVSSARRSQQQNREAAEERLADLVRKAMLVQKKRRPTRPTRASKEARIAQKRKRSETKRQRRGELD